MKELRSVVQVKSGDGTRPEERAEKDYTRRRKGGTEGMARIQWRIGLC